MWVEGTDFKATLRKKRQAGMKVAISEGSPAGLVPSVLLGILTAVSAPLARGRGRLAPGVTGPPRGGRGFLG